MNGPDELARVEQLLRPMLEDAAVGIKHEFPEVITTIRSFPVGTSTSFHGMAIALECVLANVEPDLIALEVVVKWLDTSPTIDAADVCWGHPSGSVEASLELAGQPLDAATTGALQVGLPTLIDALRVALRRGAPEA